MCLGWNSQVLQASLRPWGCPQPIQKLLMVHKRAVRSPTWMLGLHFKSGTSPPFPSYLSHFSSVFPHSFTIFLHFSSYTRLYNLQGLNLHDLLGVLPLSSLIPQGTSLNPSFEHECFLSLSPISSSWMDANVVVDWLFIFFLDFWSYLQDL